MRRTSASAAAGLLPVVEVEALLADDLVVLVPLAGDEHDVVRAARSATASSMAGAPIGLDHEAALAGLRASASAQAAAAALLQARDDLREDAPRVLGARVVGGHHDQVGAARRGLRP